MSANSRAHDKAMAAYLKEKGVRRTSANCPICHFGINLSHLMNHIRLCKGRGKGRNK